MSPFHVIGCVATLFAQAYELARCRLATHASLLTRANVQRDHQVWDANLTLREVEVLRRRWEYLPPHQRPHYRGEDRQEILLIMRLRGWTIQQTADHFALHANTVRNWVRAVETDEAERLLGRPPWNRYHDGVRWLVHRIRELCPEPEMGVRNIAAAIVRHGIAISKSTVHRVLAESEPGYRPPVPEPADERCHTDRLLDPSRINHVWHMDLTCIKLVWKRFYVTGIIDGSSRKLLALRFFTRTPTTHTLVRLIKRTRRRHGASRYLITDHGAQFRKCFKNRLADIGIRHIRGKVRSYRTNGKIERFFRTFKLWARAALLPIDPRAMQRRLDTFGGWYNTQRPHSALAGRTPDETWRGVEPPEPIPIYARDPVEPIMASAALDRLLHRSTVLNITGDSYRLKEKRQAGAGQSN